MEYQTTKWLAQLLMLLVLIVHHTAAFRFGLSPAETKCFTTELEASSTWHTTVRCPRGYHKFVGYTVTGPAPPGAHPGQLVTEASCTHGHLTHTFTISVSGDHVFCFHADPKAKIPHRLQGLGAPQITFELMDSDTFVLEGIADSPVALTGVKSQVDYVRRSAHSMEEEFRHFKDREAELRDTNESTNARTLWVTVTTVAVVVLASLYRHTALVRHLRRHKMLD
jgi:hypothetical protein